MKNLIQGKLIYGHSLQALVLYAADSQMSNTLTWSAAFFRKISCLIGIHIGILLLSEEYIQE